MQKEGERREVGPGGKKVKPAVAEGSKRNGAATVAHLYAESAQSAPANENTKSDNNYVAAAASKLEITYSQISAAAASNTDLPDSEDEFGSYAWRQPHPGIPRADAKSGKASFDGQGQMINPSQGPSATTTENTELEQSSTPDSPARVLPHHGNSLLQRVTNLIHCLGPRKMNMVKVIHHFPHVVGICLSAVNQLQDLDTTTSALQAQVDALVSANKQQQQQIEFLTEVLKQHMLLPQDITGSES